jgi:hypothetical protein
MGILSASLGRRLAVASPTIIFCILSDWKSLLFVIRHRVGVVGLRALFLGPVAQAVSFLPLLVGNRPT